MEQVNSFGQRITLIHFVYPTGEPVQPIRLACMPDLTVFHKTLQHPAFLRTDDPRGVTCAACKRTIAFKDAASRIPR
jgi:hypothetical protein